MRRFHSLLTDKTSSRRVLRKKSLRNTPVPATPRNGKFSVQQEEIPTAPGSTVESTDREALVDSPNVKDVKMSRIEEQVGVTGDPVFDDSSIDLEAIVELATLVRGMECGISRDPHCEGLDWIGFVQFLDNIEWTVRLPKPRFPDSLYDAETFRKRCESMIATIECVATRTTLPVPRIHQFDLSLTNALNRPYIFMDCLPGQPLSSLIDVLKDHQLRSIIRQWAEYMMELARLQYPAIGSLYKEDNEFIVGQLLPNSDTPPPAKSGPFKSVADYHVLSSANKKRSLLKNPKAHGSLLLPEFLNGPFVLSHRTLDIDSILVDSDGRLTGILGWQNVAVLPLQSHIRVPYSLNLEFLPPSETNASISRLIFAKRYRRHFERAMAEASFDTKWDIPDLIDRSLMYGLFEKAILDREGEKYLPALWDHIFGKEEQAETLRNAMRKSKWGLAILKRSDLSARH